MIRNIVLDMGGVLMQHNIPGCIARLKQLTGENFSRLGMDDKAEGSGLMEQFERGLITLDKFLDEVQKLCKPDTTHKQILEAWLMLHAGIPADRWAYVQQLKQEGYHLYLLSNNNDACWQDILDHYDMSVFEDVFLSHVLHIVKPQPEFFKYVQNKLQLVPEQSVFVDDIEVNRLAAEQAVGWRTAASLEELKQIL